MNHTYGFAAYVLQCHFPEGEEVITKSNFSYWQCLNDKMDYFYFACIIMIFQTQVYIIIIILLIVNRCLGFYQLTDNQPLNTDTLVISIKKPMCYRSKWKVPTTVV